MRKWFSLGKPKKNIDSQAFHQPSQATGDGRYTSQHGSELLSIEGRKRMVVLIKRAVSVTPEVWNEHYLYALEQFAELVQEHPASRVHHHSERGGLLDHTLDVTLRALRLSAGVILPPGAEPEELLHNTERWRFAVLITALLHDVGKIIGDQETVYKQGSDYVHWQPWHGPIPIGAKYIFRYRETRGDHIHGLHEKLGITLLPFLLTPSASKWLTSDRQLLGQMMHTLSASATGAGVIGELVRNADRSSAAGNLSPTTGSPALNGADKPLHTKILEALQTLANEGKLKRNLPGAAVWVTEDRSYVVAKSTMEKVRDHLLAEGQKSIPQSPLRLIQILNEHKITFLPVDGDTQQAIVNDENRSWKQKLSFLVLPNEHIWVSGVPNLFTGTITPVDGDGNEVSQTTPDTASDKPAQSDQDTEDPTKDQASDRGSIMDPPTPAVAEKVSAEEQASDRGSIVAPPTPEAPHTVSQAQGKQVSRPKEPKVVSRNRAQKPAFKNRPGSTRSPLRAKSEFFTWVLNGIKYRRVRVNESGAPIHIVGSYVAFVSPKIFDLYLDDNKANAIAYGKSRNQQIAGIQREVKSLDVHERSEGEDFFRIMIRGPRNESTVSAMLISRDQFPELERLSPNPILELSDDNHGSAV